MKKALVLALICAFGVGAAAFAGPLSGSWATTITIDPLATTIGTFIQILDSTLAVNYTIGGWVFGTSTGFTKVGFTSQAFTATGILGAFTFSSTMTFAPAAITEYDYGAFWTAMDAVFTSGLTQTPSQTASAVLCHSTVLPALTTTPLFLTWQASVAVSIAGVSLEGLLVMDYSNFDVAYVDAITELDLDTQTDYTVPASYGAGVGWRFLVSGTAGGAVFTSYTYFSMTEADVRTTFCPAVGKRGVFYLSGGCDVGFTEEYLTVTGLSFGCATLDIGLSILCDGFADIEFIAKNIIAGGWLDLDFGVIFGLDSKTIDLCMNLVGFAVDCFTLELGFGNTGYVTGVTIGTAPIIDNITLHGVGFTYKWNGVTFSSYTEFDIYSQLFSPRVVSTEYWSTLDAWASMAFLIPFGGQRGWDEGDCCETVEDCIETGTWYQLVCVPADRFLRWEKFVIQATSDACCGGALSFTITTYFGTHQLLDWFAYGIYEDGMGAAAVTWLDTGGLTSAEQDAEEAIYFADSTATTPGCDSVTYAYDYADDADLTTLFSWVQTQLALSVGIGSAVTLNVGFDVSAYGFESLSFGFSIKF